MTDDDLTTAQFDTADRVEVALESADRRGLTISAVARKVGATYSETAVVLAYMVRHQYLHTSGNGAWTHYHAGRA